MGSAIELGEGAWISVRFERPGDRNRFVLDVRSIGTDAIRVEPLGQLALRVRTSAVLRPATLALLFAHGGRVMSGQDPSEQPSPA